MHKVFFSTQNIWVWNNFIFFQCKEVWVFFIIKIIFYQKFGEAVASLRLNVGTGLLVCGLPNICIAPSPGLWRLICVLIQWRIQGGGALPRCPTGGGPSEEAKCIEGYSKVSCVYAGHFLQAIRLGLQGLLQWHITCYSNNILHVIVLVYHQFPLSSFEQ